MQSNTWQYSGKSLRQSAVDPLHHSSQKLEEVYLNKVKRKYNLMVKRVENSPKTAKHFPLLWIACILMGSNMSQHF